ncbi:MAG: YbaK/EbsC family protein [Alphaproteobacteria bacterium]|nr:YbaK/EbsC family protein [Alphaproteobacteria bacterium]
MALATSAQRVQDALAARQHPHPVQEMPASTRTSAEAAAAVGCRVEQIAKSLVFKAAGSNRAVLVIASGANRVDEKKLAELLGEKVTRPDAGFVRGETGFAIGGIPPIAHDRPLKTFIDRDIMVLGEIWAAAGTPHSVFKLTPDDLVAMTGGTVADLRKEG